jgi:hypothetical protein
MNEVMLSKIEYRKSLIVIAVLWIGVLTISLACVTPISAQEGEFIGRYDYTITLADMPLEGEIEMYRYVSNDSLQTYFGTYGSHYVSHRPNYRLESENYGYIDFSNQHAYISMDEELVKSESTYSVHLSGYQQVTITAMYEYGNYTTIVNNATLFEETYTERYYENGDFVESTDYHEYMYMSSYLNGSIYTQNVTVDAGEFECLLLLNYLFEGFDTDIDVDEDWEYFLGRSVTYVDIEEGHLVEQRQYDEYWDLVAELYLISLEDTRTPGIDPTLILIGGGAGVAIIVVAVVAKSRRGSSTGYTEESSFNY